jgi:hypothetical protein
MRRSVIAATFLAFVLGSAGASSHMRAQTPAPTAPAPISYPAGNNLVSGPPGTDFSAVDGTLSTLQTGDHDYESISPASGTSAGFGYWAVFATPASVQLAAGTSAPYTASALSGQWILIGDPSGTLPATVTGAAAVYTYDPTNGYTAATAVQPGQGAWALGSGSGSITVAPQTAAAAAAAASLRQYSGKGFVIGVPTDWDRISLGANPGAEAAAWGSSDGQEAAVVDGPTAVPAGVPLNAVRITNAVLGDPKAMQGFGTWAQVSSAPAPIAIQGADTAAQATLTGTDPQSGPFQLTLVLAVGNSNFFVLTVVSPPNPSSQDQALIQQIIQSFQLTS